MNAEMDRMVKRFGGDPASFQALLQSRDGQALIRLISDHSGSQLKQAAQAAARGHTQELTQIIRKMAQEPEGAELIQRISQQIKK